MSSSADGYEGGADPASEQDINKHKEDEPSVKDSASVSSMPGVEEEGSVSNVGGEEETADVVATAARDTTTAAKEEAQDDAGADDDHDEEERGDEEEEIPDHDDGGAIVEPQPCDVLCGRGAAVNANIGNKQFRALCFARKPEFDAGNHAAKRRIASEIVSTTISTWGSRFLTKKKKTKDEQKKKKKKKKRKGIRKSKDPYYEMTFEQAILKASQVMRDHKRPDRIDRHRKQKEDGTNKRGYRTTPIATPMDDIPAAVLMMAQHQQQQAVGVEPIIENPFGVHDNDVLCGRGALVNGHTGNKRLRNLAEQRKANFDNGSYTEKRTLATEIVMHIRNLDPPGRFLRRVPNAKATTSAGERGEQDASAMDWEELADEKAIHKACQVMRDMQRPDRKYREERRKLRQLKKERKSAPPPPPPPQQGPIAPALHQPLLVDEALPISEEQKQHFDGDDVDHHRHHGDRSIGILGEPTMVNVHGTSSTTVAGVEEAVAAAAEAMDKALEAASSHHNSNNNNINSSNDHHTGDDGVQNVDPTPVGI